MKQIRLLLILLTSISVASCSSNLNTEELQEYSTYISLAENVDFNNLTNHELEKLFSASNRIHLAEDPNGLLYIKAKSAREINVSENIYQYFLSVVDNTNAIRLSDVSKTRNSLLSRAEHEGYTNIKDCMAWAISKAKGLSYDYVSERLYNEFHGAVPYYASYQAFLMFGNINDAPVSSFTTAETFSNGNGFIVVYRSGRNYHAVNGWYQNIDGAIYCRDYQGGGDPKVVVVLFEDIEGIYYYD